MRPDLLNPLFAPVSALPGVGPRTGKLFDRLLERPAGARVLDVLFHIPHSSIDRRNRPAISQAPRDEIVTLEVRVVDHRPPSRNSKGPFRVLVEDETGDVLLVFFLANHQWIERMLPIGAKRWISGKLELWDGHLQMVHPDKVLDEEGLARLPPVEPVYWLTEGLYQRNVGKAAEAGFADVRGSRRSRCSRNCETSRPMLQRWRRFARIRPSRRGGGGDREKAGRRPRSTSDELDEVGGGRDVLDNL